MLLLVVSDFHIGKGQFFKNGQHNILEDFYEDDRFIEFLDYHGSGKYYLTEIHLVLNGDILNLIQIDVDGVFTYVLDEDHTTRALELIAKGHRRVFHALRRFLSRPNKSISYMVGNHDAGMVFKKAQDKFCELVGGRVNFAFDMNIAGIHIEHGHRFEIINAVPSNGHFMDGPNGKTILNLPWGSLFCITNLPKLKKKKPYIDKVRPMPTYIKGMVFYDPLFFIQLFFILLKYFIETNLSAFTKQNQNFKTTVTLLKQVTIYPRYGKRAKAILNNNPELNTVIMGHTHLLEWRKFPGGKFYFNTGTWNSIPSTDEAMHQSLTKLSYVLIDVHVKSKTIKKASLNVWKGEWRPFREDVSLTM
ncbi:MAG: hypothetical protein ISR65_17845 [Bacteriovoracaceae bacterium]|nr:hypothetical protein [Bacteriovoracaceae bacterium]